MNYRIREKLTVRSIMCRAVLLFCLLLLAAARRVSAQDGYTVREGVYVETQSLGGLSEKEAAEAIHAYAALIGKITVTLFYLDNPPIELCVDSFSPDFEEERLLEQVISYANTGSIITRFKARKDLEQRNQVFKLPLSFSVDIVEQTLRDACSGYDKNAVDASLLRIGDVFQIVPGTAGQFLDSRTSAEMLCQLLTKEWDKSPVSLTLSVREEPVADNEEELLCVSDILGTFTTTYAGSGQNRCNNIENGCKLIDGTLLYPGEIFSMLERVAPFTEENGYQMAGTFVNGELVDGLGGGICQVASTLYNAALISELTILERHNHSRKVSYVKPAMDASIAEEAGKDLRFQNNTEHPIYIEGVIENQTICFTIYGADSRPAEVQLRFESENVPTTIPDTEKAILWKIAVRDQEEIEWTKINQSIYNTTEE